MALDNMGGYKVYHNSQGDWKYQIVYSRTAKDFAVVVCNVQTGEHTTIAHANSFLQGEELFNAWLKGELNNG